MRRTSQTPGGGRGVVGVAPLSGQPPSLPHGQIAGLYDLEDTLGSGHFAVVKLARHVFTGEKVAVKVIDKTKLDEVSRSHLFQEVRCMKLVQHPNVVRLYEVIDTQTKLYLILELGDGGDLYDLIMRHESGLTETLAKEYFRQIVRAISYCHRLHVVHRDLKPENVVFFSRLGVVKLTDFGFSNRYYPGQKLQTSCGSLAYSAPEILLGDSYDAPAVDVWSLGVILYMLVCGQAPFQEANDSETLTMIMDCKYSVPNHVSATCKSLIASMLVREPDRRATLHQIASDAWLTEDVTPGGSVSVGAVEILPLVSRQQVSEDDHNLIVTKMVNGNIAAKDEILEALDKNEYNHITATYFLLAERKLRAHRQEAQRKRVPLTLPVTSGQPGNVSTSKEGLLVPSPSGQNMLTVPRTPGDGPQNRARKCSIVQEEADEDDLPVREELAPPLCSLSRRGSRSEGRLNLALQERLAEAKAKHLVPERDNVLSGITGMTRVTDGDTSRLNIVSASWKRQDRPHTTNDKTPKWRAAPVHNSNSMENNNLNPVTTVLSVSSTITIPIHSTTTIQTSPPKFKTMPSPTRTTPLNEICEEGDAGSSDSANATPRPAARHFVSRQTATPQRGYDQRRSKFNKSRTASCSSSDASDDDSESRKKRAHKISSNGKPLPPRRDSHDDSSDSQDPQGGSGGAGSGHGGDTATHIVDRGNPVSGSHTNTTTKNTGTDTGSGSKQCSGQPVSLGRRHRTGRRRASETRLRESQSLNRITEVQEPSCQHSIVISTTLVAQAAPTNTKTRGLGARILHSWGKKSSNDNANAETVPDNKENLKNTSYDTKPKKLRLLGKYFQVHKKLCIPLPNLFNRGRMYKAQSCGSLVRDRITLNPDQPHSSHGTLVHAGKGKLLRACLGDVNQNVGHKNVIDAAIVPLMCQVHLKDVTKCCSMC